MRRTLLITTGWILLWALAVAAAVFVEAAWFAHPAVTRGAAASIEKQLVQKLQTAVAERQLGLVLMHGGKLVAEHSFGVANAAGLTCELALQRSPASGGDTQNW